MLALKSSRYRLISIVSPYVRYVDNNGLALPLQRGDHRGIHAEWSEFGSATR